MGYIDLAGVGFRFPDGRPLLSGVTFRVGEGAKVALVGANGAGKTTLLRIVSGELAPSDGTVARDGSLGVMRQFVGSVTDDTTVGQLLRSVAAPSVRVAGQRLAAAERSLWARDDEPAQLRYAQALADWGDAGGYDAEVFFDVCCTAALQERYADVADRPVRTLSGGEQKQLVLEALLRGGDDVLLLDEPDNYLDVPAKEALEERLRESAKTVLYVSHDRELLARTATRVVTVELGAAGNTTWVHGGGFASYEQARRDRFARLEELRRRWDEQHAKLRALVALTKHRATVNDGAAAAYKAAQTRLAKFEAAGPPQALPRRQHVRMRLAGGRTGKRAVVCERLALTGLTARFDAEIHYGERVAVLGANGSGKSQFLRLLAAGGTDPDAAHLPVGDAPRDAVAHTGRARLGARVRPGWFAQTHEHPELLGRSLLAVLHRGDGRRVGLPREDASRALDRYELAGAGEQGFGSLSGGQQARFQILLLELSGATLLLLDEPTDNLDVESAAALEQGLRGFAGTVLAVTHDRWFAREFDRFLVFGTDGVVAESAEPVWAAPDGRTAR